MIIKANYSVSCLTDINLRDLIIIVLADKIINSRAVNSRKLLCLRKQRTRNNVGCHRREMSADGTNTIGLTIMVYDFKFFADCHFSFLRPVSN